jgi:hypothetical protein
VRIRAFKLSRDVVQEDNECRGDGGFVISLSVLCDVKRCQGTATKAICHSKVKQSWALVH